MQAMVAIERQTEWTLRCFMADGRECDIYQGIRPLVKTDYEKLDQAVMLATVESEGETEVWALQTPEALNELTRYVENNTEGRPFRIICSVIHSVRNNGYKGHTPANMKAMVALADR